MYSIHVSDTSIITQCGWFTILVILMEHRASATGAILNTEGAPTDQWDMESPIPVALNDTFSCKLSGWTFCLPWYLD